MREIIRYCWTFLCLCEVIGFDGSGGLSELFRADEFGKVDAIKSFYMLAHDGRQLERFSRTELILEIDVRLLRRNRWTIRTCSEYVVVDFGQENLLRRHCFTVHSLNRIEAQKRRNEIADTLVFKSVEVDGVHVGWTNDIPKLVLLLERTRGLSGW